MMKSFEDISGEIEDLEEGGGIDRYCISIKNPLQFALTIDYLSTGFTFRQSSQILQMTKERTGHALLGCLSDVKAANYARFACAINLQKISELIQISWTFSIALDMTTHMGISYLDIRIRFHLKAFGIVNVHFLAIPVFDRHTGEKIFLTAAKAFNSVCNDWCNIIVGCSSDGEGKMTGRVSDKKIA